MTIGAIILLAVLVAVLFYAVGRARPLFIIRLRDGSARLQRGDAPESFVRACTDVARIAHLERGRIYGFRGAKGVRLKFSRAIPDGARQQFRNVWPYDEPPGPRPTPPGRPPRGRVRARR